ncbi:MAG: pseudaminic acid cytidylyltransferase [Saprospiraceae bacterium]|nr:pseudaminic acid cytidylyltransferase [Saprospiraceae bacterium]
MSKIAIIPARGGSKRIKGKNIRDFCGKAIIAYSIESAINSGIFDEVMVSTDNDDIASIAKSYGAEVPFLRSQENASDHATTYAVINEVLNEYIKRGRDFKYCCCLYPTAPFVTPDMLMEAWTKLNSSGVEAVFTITPFSYPIQRALHLVDANPKMKHPENVKKRSQDLEAHYHDAGMFYFYKSRIYLEKKTVFEMQSKAIIVPELRAQDIDNETDWKLAELKYRFLNNEIND